MRLDTQHALRHVLCLSNPSRMQAVRWDESGHTTYPAACFVPVESEPHAGGEVGWDTVRRVALFTNLLRTLERYRLERYIGDICTCHRHIFWHSAPRTNPRNGYDWCVFYVSGTNRELLVL